MLDSVIECSLNGQTAVSLKVTPYLFKYMNESDSELFMNGLILLPLLF